MVSKNRVYDITSDSRYYIKQVAIHLAYSDLDDAKKVAENMLEQWKKEFVEIYHALHTSQYLQAVANTLFSSAGKGAVIRYANWILQNYLLTGKVGYNAMKMKLTKNGISDEYADALIAYTVCGAYSIPAIKGFLSQYAPMLANALNDACPQLSLTPTPGSQDILNVINAVASNKPPTMPRSVFYYYFRGLTPYSATNVGSAGGEVTQPPSIAVVPSQPTAVGDALAKIIENLNKYVR